MSAREARRWRRRLASGGVLLLLGVVTTVGVSWGLAFRGLDDWGGMISSPIAMEGKRVAICEVHVHRDIGSLFMESWCGGPEYGIGLRIFTDQELGEIVPTWAAQSSAPWLGGEEPPPRGSEFEMRELLARGFPFLAMYTVLDKGTDTQNVRRSGIVVPGRKVAFSQTLFGTEVDVVLPLKPVWTGFAANTACYAACWWAVLALPLAWRRRRRRRRGACPWCGYDLRGLAQGAACPECGGPATASSAAIAYEPAAQAESAE